MRVLVLHSRYLSGAVSGENRVVDDESKLLRDAGHDVVTWQPSVEPGAVAVRLASEVVWSRRATHDVRRLVREHRPDVVHVHNLFPRLSPAVLHAVPDGMPIVMTLHNFRLMCLPSNYLRDGSICEDCARKLPWRGVVHACYRGSRAESAALATSYVVHRALATFSRVDRFLAVSEFVRSKHLEVGLEPERVLVKSNFAWPTTQRSGAGGPVLFLGRISPEKGLETVLRALPSALELVVAGDGPDRPRLETEARGRVTFLGPVDAAQVPRLLRDARALVVPSSWYEGQPRVILEAFAAGVPVLASQIGGLPELVDEGVNGYLVEVGDVRAWSGALSRLADDRESQRLGEAALSTWQRRFTPDTAVQELENAYAGVLSGERA